MHYPCHLRGPDRNSSGLSSESHPTMLTLRTTSPILRLKGSWPTVTILKGLYASLPQVVELICSPASSTSQLWLDVS